MSYINRTIVVQSDSRYLTQRVTAMIAGYDQAMATIGGIQQAADRANAAADRAEDIAESVSGMVLSYADMQALRDSTNALIAGTTVSVRTNGAWKVAPAAATDTHFSRLDGVRFYEAGPIFTTRARMAQAVARGDLAEGDIRMVRRMRYQVDPTGPDGLLALDMDWRGGMDRWVARMKAGGAVTAAAFGDSLIDGNGSTGWTPNPTNGDGTAVGSTAHEPPNAWPAVLQTTLRAMHANSGITIWNAGYGGKTVIDGWARNNLRRAIIDNPAYGTPNLLLIGFGVNDVVHPSFTVEGYYTQFRYILSQCDYWGIVPVILTPDPVAALNFGRQAGNATTVTEVLRRLAGEFGVDAIEVHDAMTEVMDAIGGNSRWRMAQPDGTHGGDSWHSVKAGYIAARLNPNTLWLGDDAVANVASWSRHANTHRLTYDLTAAEGASPINNAVGASMNVQAGTYAVSQRLIDMWVWSVHDARRIFWNSVDGDGFYSPRALADAPRLTNYSYLTRVASNIPSPTAGQAQGAAGRRAAETPAFVGTLYPGLSRISFLAPADNNTSAVFLGYFSFCERATFANFAQAIPASGAGLVVYDSDQYGASPLIGGYGMGRSLDMVFEASLPPGSGVMLLAERIFGGSSYITDNGRRGLALFRSGANTAVLYHMTFSAGGAAVVGAALATASLTWGATNQFRARFQMSAAGEQQILIFAGWDSNTPLLSVNMARGSEMLPLGGRPGPIFKQFDIAGGGAGVFRVLDMSQS